MIDTIIFTIPKTQYSEKLVLNNKIFSTNTNSTSFKTFQKEKGAYGYFPKISIVKRATSLGLQVYLKVEASLPKLIYGNNIEELSDAHLNQVALSLLKMIQSVGIDLTVDDINNAKVSVIHYSKNILLTKGYTSRFIIGELSKIDIRKSFDFSKIKYTNDGQSVYAYTNSHSMVIYDKIADNNKPVKRSIEKDKYACNLPKDIEILRFEIRLCNRRKIRDIFKQIGYTEDVTVKNIFKSIVSRDVINLYWNNLIKNNHSVIYATPEKDIDILKHVMLQYGTLKIKNALYLTALNSIARNGNGLKELRNIFVSVANDRTWYRIKSDIKKLGQIENSKNTREWLVLIENSLDTYEPIKINSP